MGDRIVKRGKTKTRVYKGTPGKYRIEDRNERRKVTPVCRINGKLSVMNKHYKLKRF